VFLPGHMCPALLAMFCPKCETYNSPDLVPARSGYPVVVEDLKHEDPEHELVADLTDRAVCYVPTSTCSLQTLDGLCVLRPDGVWSVSASKKCPLLVFSRYSEWLLAGPQRCRSSSLFRVKNYFFSTASKPALWPIQPPFQWVPETLSQEVKRPGREADHSPPTIRVRY
jgi:hypothetical protein